VIGFTRRVRVFAYVKPTGHTRIEIDIVYHYIVIIDLTYPLDRSKFFVTIPG